MSALSIQQMADRVAALMQDRLGARGPGLQAALDQRGGRLPRKVRQAATDLAKAAAMAQNPRLLLQIDHESLARNYDLCLRHLGGLKPHRRWLAGTMAIAASVAVSLLLVALLVIGVMRWRGLI